MTMTNDLSAAVAKIKELDAKRTQGGWLCKQYTNYSGFSIHPITGGFGCITERWEEGATEKRRAAMFDNAVFIAHAPKMASIITQQDAIIEQQRAVLRQAREALDTAKQNAYMIVALGTGDKPTLDWATAIRKNALAAIAAIDAALNEGV